MSFGSQAILQSFMADNNFLTKDLNTVPAGFEEASAQADDLIYQKSAIPVPDDPTTMPATLRNIWCKLMVWITTGHQDNLSDNEYKRRKDLRDEAYQMLDDIQSGDFTVIDDTGAPVNPKVSPSGWHSNALNCSEPL